MAQTIRSEPALSDLTEIAEFIALDNFQAASGLVQKVFATVERPEQYPNSGRHPPELEKQTRYREIIVGPCRVFYRVENETVYIVYVMRGELDLRIFLLTKRPEEGV